MERSYDSSYYYSFFFFEVFASSVSNLLISHFFLEITVLVVVFIYNPPLLSKGFKWTLPIGCLLRCPSFKLLSFLAFDLLNCLLTHRL